MKVISYSIFSSSEAWLFPFYMRGLVWNVKMNRLIYPDWQTHIEIEDQIFTDYDNIFYALKEHYGISFNVNPPAERCKAMLWRLKPIWENTELVLCRDADAITTFREQAAVNEWLESGAVLHGIIDNPAHGSLKLMGGMCGFKSAAIKETFQSWDSLMLSTTMDFSKHGSDQNFMNRCIVPYFSHHLSDMIGRGSEHNNKLWESDLTCRHIGSAGVVEMETIRFFNKFPNPMEDVEQRYKDIFNWYI